MCLVFSICDDYGNVALSQWCSVRIDKHNNKCVIVCQNCFDTFCLVALILSPPAETIRQGFCTLLWTCEVWVWSIRCGKKEDIYTWAGTLCNLLTHEPNISKWIYTLFISLSCSFHVCVCVCVCKGFVKNLNSLWGIAFSLSFFAYPKQGVCHSKISFS